MHFFKHLTSLALCLSYVSCQALNTSSSAVFVYDASTAYQYVFALSVDSTTDDVYLYISGPSTDAWLGFGLGTAMKDSLMFITYVASDGTDLVLSPRLGAYNAEPSYDSRVSCTAVNPGMGIDSNSNNMYGYWKCQNVFQVANIPSSNMSDSTQPFIFAFGPPAFTMNTDALDAPLRKHDFHGQFTMDMKKATSANATVPQPEGPNNGWSSLNASPAFSTQVDSNRIPAAHGLLMCAAFIFVFPFGSLILRLKHFVKAHVVVQLIGAMLVVIGAGLGFSVSKQYNRSKNYSSPHQVLGIVIFAVVLIQIGLGFLGHRQNKTTQKRTPFSLVHFILGPLIIVLGLVNGGLGFNFAGNPWNIFQYYICIIIAVALLFFAARATCYCLARRRHRREQPEAQEETGYQYPEFGQPPPYHGTQSLPMQTFFPPPPQQKNQFQVHAARIDHIS